MNPWLLIAWIWAFGMITGGALIAFIFWVNDRRGDQMERAEVSQILHDTGLSRRTMIIGAAILWPAVILILLGVPLRKGKQ